MFCPSCGVESTNKVKYCKNCGASLTPAVNPVEVHISPPPIATTIASMTWAIATFGIIGFVAALVTLRKVSQTELFSGNMMFTFIFCFLFIFLIASVLSWQLGRLISTYRDSVKRAIDGEKIETAIPVQPALPPQRQPLYVPAVQEPVSGVTEHTTRSFNPSLEK
jgi:multisubunit Na+/H+ antiporter MnhG subunit